MAVCGGSAVGASEHEHLDGFFRVLTLYCRLLIWAPGVLATCTFRQFGVVGKTMH